MLLDGCPRLVHLALDSESGENTGGEKIFQLMSNGGKVGTSLRKKGENAKENEERGKAKRVSSK
jgi:hypothetical protein